MKYTNEELLAYREKWKGRADLITENFVMLCRLIEGEKENFKVETPFGDIIFYPLHTKE